MERPLSLTTWLILIGLSVVHFGVVAVGVDMLAGHPVWGSTPSPRTLLAPTLAASASPTASLAPTLGASASPTASAALALTPVTLADGIAPGLRHGTAGFGIKSLVVARNSYITVLARTDPNLAGSTLEIWIESKTSDWHLLTLRRVAANGTVHYFARVKGWTAYRVKFPGDATHAPAISHGRVATDGR